MIASVQENWKLEKLKAQNCCNQGLIENLWKIVWSVPTSKKPLSKSPNSTKGKNERHMVQIFPPQKVKKENTAKKSSISTKGQKEGSCGMVLYSLQMVNVSRDRCLLLHTLSMMSTYSWWSSKIKPNICQLRLLHSGWFTLYSYFEAALQLTSKYSSS